ncbi:CorA metal ion transporter [Coemansia interrupta]|uniref:CorA metal ion transporter n=1 Tax=Coemansia interrupta TaxID=1126814 RepID=A0A9W8LJT7_9FUNG|nr:CorA metal ion transporter [Coemansia interrupta]
MGKKSRNSAGRRRNARQQPAEAQAAGAPGVSSDPPASPTQTTAEYLASWRKPTSSRHSSTRPLSSHHGTSEDTPLHPTRRRSSSSSGRSSNGGGGSHSTGGQGNLASVISQYMFGMDSDTLASQYYGNMAHMHEMTADRLPRPMNSTLPLFSPSVVHGRRLVRARSSQGSEGDVGRKRGSAVTLQRAEEGGRGSAAEAPLAPVAMGHAATYPSAPADFPLETRVLESESTSNSGVEHKDAEQIPEPNADEQPAPGTPDNLETTAEQPSAHDESTASPATAEISEKGHGLGVQFDSRPSSQVRSRRSQHIGPTQYTPAASANKKTAVARGAPGLSYMFSPTIGSSRPSSIVGTATPTQPPPSRVQTVRMLESSEETSPSSLVHEGNDQRAGSAENAPFRSKTFGSINIGALEQFLDEGEIPESTSDEEYSDDDLAWEEDYPGTDSRSRGSYSDQSTCSSTKSKMLRATQSVEASPQLRQPLTLPRRYGSENGNYRVPSQVTPRVRSAEHRPSSVPDERAPLLGHTAISVAPEESEYLVPAELQNYSIGNSQAFSKKSGLKGRRRRRRHHEELFLDKDGFIDESYRFTFFNPAVGTIRAQEFADLRTPDMDLSELLQVGGCFWIDVLRPSLQEMHLLSKIFNIHALTVEDIMTQDMREKGETHANYYFVCFRSFDNDPNSETYLEPKCIYNIVLREGIITFHMEPSVHQYHVLRRIRRQIDHIVVTPDWLNYAIIDDITDLIAPILQLIEFDVDRIDELVLVISSSEQSDMLLRISTARKRIMMVLRLLQGKADVVRALIKRFESATAMSTSQINALAGTASVAGPLSERQTVWSESPQRRTSANDSQHALVDGTAMELAIDHRKGQETLLYLGDVLDHIVTMMQNAAHYDNILGRAHANYLAQISIELTESSNRTNDVVAKLSALAAIVVPLNFITGMWGANVKVPGQDYEDLHYFFYILGCCMLYVVIAVAWARHYDIF